MLSGCSALATQEAAEDVPASVCFGAHATTTSSGENLYIAPLILACAGLQCVRWVHLSLQEYCKCGTGGSISDKGTVVSLMKGGLFRHFLTIKSAASINLFLSSRSPN